jgi:hypothetical protein
MPQPTKAHINSTTHTHMHTTTTTHTVPPTLVTLLSYSACLTTNQTHESWHFLLFVWPSSSWSSLRVESKSEQRTLKQLTICYLFNGEICARKTRSLLLLFSLPYVLFLVNCIPNSCCSFKKTLLQQATKPNTPNVVLFTPHFYPSSRDD